MEASRDMARWSSRDWARDDGKTGTRLHETQTFQKYGGLVARRDSKINIGSSDRGSLGDRDKAAQSGTTQVGGQCRTGARVGLLRHGLT